MEDLALLAHHSFVGRLALSLGQGTGKIFGLTTPLKKH